MLAVFLTFSVIGGGLLLYGLIKTQGVNGEFWREKSKERRTADLSDPARRGDIYSSDGKTLATTITVCDLYIDLGYREVKTADKVAQRDKNNKIVYDTTIKRADFVRYLDTVCLLIHEAVPSTSKAEWRRKLVAERSKQRPNQCFLVARNIPYTSWLKLKEVKGWGRGVIEQVEDKEDINKSKDVRHHMRMRIYDNLAGNVIGFKNGMLDCYTGLEGYYDSILRGQDGLYEARRLTRGVWLPETPKRAKVDGQHITATIDTRYQDIAEQSLRQALTDRHATSGCVVLMEASTGYVLACANLCNDTSNRSRYIERIDRNMACSDRMHPGSTFKTVVVAAAMNDDSVHVDTNMRLRSNYKNFDGTEQGEIKDEHPVGDTISLAEAVIYSSNVAMADFGWKLYRKRRSAFKSQVQRVFPSEILHLDVRTNESRQRINNLRPNRDFLNFCFGYSTAVSPMQLITFYNAIANDGRMMKPLFCRSIITDNGVTEIKPIEMEDHRLNLASVQFLRNTLQRVVSDGTATSIRGTSYGIAGKTGTAKVNVEEGSTNDAFFVGFFPAEQPKYTCLVLIHNTYSSGGAASAPVLKRVADGVMALDKDLGKVKMDRLDWKTADADRVPSTVKGYMPEIMASYKRMDMPFALADSNYRWVTYQEDFQNYSPRTDIMPNCVGMTIKDAMRLLDELGIKVRFSGYGRVKSQQPKARTPIRRGNTAVLTLEY
ncbi:MAG: transpeptidase family protein [Bacteroidales bacterium]|nr:transpeptidase family protein [Bacteroidales bacterium]